MRPVVSTPANKPHTHTPQCSSALREHHVRQANETHRCRTVYEWMTRCRVCGRQAHDASVSLQDCANSDTSGRERNRSRNMQVASGADV